MLQGRGIGTALFRIALVPWLFVGQQLEAQIPGPIQAVALGEQRLELYTVIKKPFGLDHRDPLFRFMDDDQLNRITGPIALGPWETSSGSKLNRDAYVLGFVLRNSRGELPSGMLRLATAFRATNESKEVSSYWPRVGKNPLNEISNYEWDYQLAPLIVELPKGSKRIDQLEAAIVHIPQDQTAFKFSKQDIVDGVTAYADQIVTIAAGRANSEQGTFYNFLVCRGTKKISTASGLRKQSGLADEDSQYSIGGLGSTDLKAVGKTSYGESVTPNLVSRVGVDDVTRRKVVQELVAKTRGQPNKTAVEEAIMGVLTDPKAEFSLLRVGFKGEKIEFEQIDLTVSVATGLPKCTPFVLSDIPLDAAADEDEINRFIAGLAIEKSAGIASPLAFRQWTDVSGNYRVNAKLVSVQDGVVTLQKEDGTTVSVPLARLSVADREYAATSSK